MRPNIHSLVNEELDALMFLAFLIESIFKKTKRLKLVEVISLLKEITNVEMDLRFEAAAAGELRDNTINDEGIIVPKIYWNYTSKRILTLDRIDGVSIREVKQLKALNIDHKKTFEAVYTAVRPTENEAVKTLICFETMSGTEWASPSEPKKFSPNFFIELSENEIYNKTKAMNCYKYEKRDFPHPRSSKAIINRGILPAYKTSPVEKYFRI